MWLWTASQAQTHKRKEKQLLIVQGFFVKTGQICPSESWEKAHTEVKVKTSVLESNAADKTFHVS